MTEKELTAREVRRLPEFAKVTIHGRDRRGYPTRTLCFVHALPGGKKVLQPIGLFCNGFIEIRKGDKYTTTEESE
ncbi:MAG: hypothetical protein IJJ45_01145 [Clostridia bacterium]|nr:hypothetical protein [Clostridia bacterium]